MTRITEPGIYDLPADAYHADPCPQWSLSSTGARTIARECPALYLHERQNPVRKQEFDIGSAAHLLVLEPDLFAERVVCCGPDYKTKAAQEKRDAAHASGKIPLRDGDMDLIRAMRAAIQSDPIASQAFIGGKAEQSLLWRDPEFGVWRRTRPDYLPPHHRYLVDLKTSGNSNPEELRKDLYKFGYYAQAAWYLDGVAALTGSMPERFAFVIVSKKPPHLVTTIWLTDRAIEWGRIQNRYAIGLFAHCLRTGEWPGYRPDGASAAQAFTMDLPEWAERAMERRHEAGGFEPPPIPLMQEAAE